MIEITKLDNEITKQSNSAKIQEKLKQLYIENPIQIFLNV